MGVPERGPVDDTPKPPRKPKGPPKLDRPTEEADRNFVIPDGFEPSPGAAKKRIDANFAAIKLLRALEEEGRNPTPEEKRILVAYSGWGSFKEAFNTIEYKRAKSEIESMVRRHGENWKDKVDRTYNAGYAKRLLEMDRWMERHGELHERLLEELTDAEFEAASVSIMNAHFTSAEVIDAVWDMARTAGFRGGKALEPAGGVGHFIGRTPEDLQDNTSWEAVELDEVTSRIMAKLYPEARVNSARPSPSRTVSGQGFQDARIPNNSQDLVISNVPFYEVGPAESQEEFGIQFNLHNYFFARALAKAKPGGLVAFITTHNTMDSSFAQRKWLAENSEFVHAIRLPNTAFKANAGTEVVTDIIILRKPDGSGQAPVNHRWNGTVQVGEDEVQSTIVRGTLYDDPKKKDLIEGLHKIPRDWVATDPAIADAWAAWNEKRPASGASYKALQDALYEHGLTKLSNGIRVIRTGFRAPVEANEFFAANPDLVLGKQSLTGSMYSENDYNVLPPEGGQEAYLALLDRAVKATPDVGQAMEAEIEERERLASDAGDRPGSYLERDGKFYHVAGDELVLQDWKPGQEGLFRSWNDVLKNTEQLLRLEQDTNAGEGEIEAQRALVNSLFDEHVKRYGHPADPNARRNKHRFLRDDSTGYALVQSLETVTQDVDRDGKTIYHYGKAPLLKGRVLRPIKEPDSADSIEDAVAASMGFRGRLDLEYMSLLRDSDRDTIRKEVIEAGYAFEDPISGLLVGADEYLSGNVVEKRKQAEAAAGENPEYNRNVAALIEVRPEPRNIAQIGLNIGATWIPNEVYSAFAAEVLGYPGVMVTAESESRGVRNIPSVQGNPEFGTERMAPIEIFERLLTKKTIEVRVPKKDTILGRAKGTTIRDDNATAQAQVKADQIRREFETWTRTTAAEVGADGRTVSEVVEEAFNEKVNVIRPPSYKGDWVTLPGQSGEIWLKPHRKAVLARMITQGNGMMAHGVGSGKTLALVALAHELKRLGKARKPVIVAMNSTVEQFAASYKQAYPQANLLVANTQGNFSEKKRAAFYSQMATGDFDAIIMPHSTLKQIPHEESAIREFYSGQIQELMAALERVSSDDKVAMKDIRKAIDKLREKMEKAQAGAKKFRDEGALTWEQIGVDALLVDEAHAFKNAPVVTKMKNVKNLPTGEASDNALSMMLKAAGVQSRTKGRNVYFATGTPITNTMAEAYVMLRYLSPGALKDIGINNFDDFADAFAETVTKPEATWKGQVAMTTRLAKFVNGQALINLVRSVFDVALGNDKLGLYVPRVKGGKPEQIVVPVTETASELNDWFLDVADAYDAIPPKELRENDKLGAIPILTMMSGISGATDPRLIDPRAKDDPGSKVNVMIDRLMGIYEAGKEKKTAQVIFSDIRNPFNVEILSDLVGMPFDGSQEAMPTNKFDLYEDIKAKLVAKGVKPSEIWWPPENAKPEALSAAYDKVNSGEIRIVIGSTQRIGTGVNFQERLAAAHHLSPPRDMKPAMMEQRNGRIIRQGNLHREWADNAFASVVEQAAGDSFPGETAKERRKQADAWLKDNPDAAVAAAAREAEEQYEIEIIEYALSNSIDSAIFSMMAAKQGFIAQVLSSTTSESEFADPADEVQMGMAEIAARTMGDPDMIRLVEMEREVKELRAQSAAHVATIAAKRQARRSLEAQLESQVRAKEALESWGDRHVGVLDNSENPPVWKFGNFTVDPKSKEKDAPSLTGALTTWLAQQKDAAPIFIGPLELRVGIHGGASDSKEGNVGIFADNGLLLSRRNFVGPKSMLMAARKVIQDLDGMAERNAANMASVERELDQLGANESTAFPGADRLRALEQEFADVQGRVKERLAEEKARRQEKRGNRSMRATRSSAAGAFASEQVTKLAAATTPFLDLDANWKEWPLAETVMDIAGIPEPVRKPMRVRPKLNVLEKHAGGKGAFERAMENAGLAMERPLAMAAVPSRIPRISIPDAMIAHPLSAAANHPDHTKAKSGEAEAAYRLARDLIDTAFAERVAAAVPNDSIIVPVIAIEATGANKIPLAVAREIARNTGLPITVGIQQAAKVDRSGATGLDRIFKAVPFNGEVVTGSSYVLVDDTLTQGGTFAGLANHITARGGRVVGVVALTGKQYSAKIQLSDETLSKLRDKHGEVESSFRRYLGYGFDALTESEARYLANFKPSQQVRDRILEEGKRGSSGGDGQDGASRGTEVEGGTPLRMATPRERANNESFDDHEAIRAALDALGGQLPEESTLEDFRQKALSEPEGERTIGNPGIANIAEQEDIRREFDVVRQAYEESRKAQTHEQWNESAHELIRRDADGVMRALLEFAREGVAIDSPVMVKAAQIMIPRIWAAAKSTGDKQSIRDAQALTLAYQKGGTLTAQALGARRDPHKTPEERNLEFLAGVISRVPPAVEKAAALADTPAQKAREIERLRRELKDAQAKTGGSKADSGQVKRLKKELEAAEKAKDRAEILGEAHEARLAKVEAALREMGITLHEIFSHQAVVRLRGSEIVARIIEDNFTKQQRAALRGRIDKVSPNQLKKTTGLTKEEIIQLQSRFKGLMRKRFLELAKRGMTLADFQHTDKGLFDLSQRIGEDGSVLRAASAISDEQAAAAADEMMDALFGDEKSYRKGTARKPAGSGGGSAFDPGSRVHTAQAARVIQSSVDSNRFDMAYEYWINNILGGPETQVVNITGNSLNAVLEYGMQRPIEAAFNTLVGAADGPTLGEYAWLKKALPKAIAPAMKHAVITWLTEESFLEADLLRDPALVGEPLEKVMGSAGGSGSRRAIPDKIAGIGTSGARSLPGAFYDYATGKGWKGWSVGRTVRIPGRMLLFMDTLMKGIVAHTEVAAVAYRKAKADGLKGEEMENFIFEEMGLPGSDSWYAAMEKGREMTFTTELKGKSEIPGQGGGMFEQLVLSLQKARIAGKDLGPAAAFLVGWFFPFIQTPFNIFKVGLRRTPFGAFGIAANLWRSGLYSRKIGSAQAFIDSYPKARMVRDMADQTIAWITTAILLSLTEGDDDDDDKPILITGSRPWGIDSSGERELLERGEGGPFMIRVGKRGPDAVYFDYGRMEPFATVLASIADSVRAIKRIENGADRAQEITKLRAYAMSQAQDKTFLQGIVSINEMLNPTQTFKNAPRTFVQALVPNIVRQPLRNLDDYVRESKTAPWYYHALPVGGFAEPKYDLHGNPVKKSGTPLGPVLPDGADRVARIFTDTGLEPAANRHPADTALINWNRKNPHKDDQYFPSSNSIREFKDLLGNRHDLSATQVAELNRRGGQKLAMMLRGQISPAEAANPTMETIDKIRKARSRVFVETRNEIIKEPKPRPRKGVTTLPGKTMAEIFGWNTP